VATGHLQLALSLDDSLAGVLGLLGLPAAPKAEGLRPGVLALSALTGEPAPGPAAGSGAGDRCFLAGVEILLADPWDVPVLVERGAADAGVAPKHVLAELRPDLFEVLDLRLAEKRLAHVATASARPPATGRRPRLATAHPRLTRAHFECRGVQVETLALRSAAELAAALGAADGAVVLLPPGAREIALPWARPAGGAQAAGMSVQAEVLRSSARLIVNRSARAVRAAEVGLLVESLREAVRSHGAARGDAGRPPSDH
jgi:ATP phosphoribosyltransferase